VAAVSYPDWGPFRLLNLNWVRFMGTISYSFYLVHYTVIKAVKFHAVTLPAFLQGPMALALSIAIAYAIYRLVELPLSHVRRRLTHRDPADEPAQSGGDGELSPAQGGDGPSSIKALVSRSLG
jgi:peptidoglycan/LPS O-acetylase OafA/YrhL